MAKRLESIDMLRGLAVAAVVIEHSPFSTIMNPSAPDAAGAASALPVWLTSVMAFGRSGVNLFLLISGFCIHLATAKGMRLGFGSFWIRRMRRLYPPYLAAVLLTLGSLALYHGVIRGHRESLHALLGYDSANRCFVDLLSLVFQFQNVTGAGARIGNSPLWTLALEEQLYMLYFALLALRARFSWGVVLGAVLAITLGFRAVALLGWGPAFLLSLGPARWTEWALGALAAELYVRSEEPLPWFLRPKHLAPAAILAYAAASFHRPTAQLFCDTLLGIFFFAVIVAASRINARATWRPGLLVRRLAALGLISYSVYLTHTPLLFLAKQLGLRAHLGVPLIMALRLGTALAGGIVFFFLIERRFLTRASEPRPDAVPATS